MQSTPRRSRAQNHRRHHWTDEEEEQLKVIFKDTISVKKLPKLADIGKKIRERKQFSYILHEVSLSSIKNKIVRIINK